MTASLLAFAAVLLLMFARLPIAVAMGIAGVVGFASVVNLPAALSMLGQTTFDTVLSYELTVVPLFTLMGAFVTRAGLSRDLYEMSNAFLGHRRGGLAMATIVACGGFSAVCGSSLATAATMSRVAMPSMRRFGYADSLATGAIAAGGTLGILIPPSVIFIIYGVLTGADIGKLFLAGVIPGLVGLLGYLLVVMWVTHRHPEKGPPGPRSNWSERLRALRAVGNVLVLFAVVIGGLYLGVFTPTEAAGIGAAASFCFVLLRHGFAFRMVFECLVETARISSAIYILVIGAALFSNLINVTGMPGELSIWTKSMNLSGTQVLIAILVIYLLLGCVLESLSMILLTVPVFYPLVLELGMPGMTPQELLIWFAVLVVVVTEIGLITPPVGMNLFVLRSVMPDVPTGTIVRGVLPFVWIDIVRLTLLFLVPALSLWLPSTM